MPGQTIRDAVAKRGEAAPPEPDGGGAVLALREDQTWWTPRQIAALKAMGIKNASQEDMLVFLHYCAKTRLDPFSKQVYLLERRTKEGGEWVSKQTVQVGIDGYRLIAQRAAQREGVYIEYEETIWFDHDEQPHRMWLSDKPPAAALVTVVKHLPSGVKLRFPGMARFDSYAAWSRGDNRYLTGQWGVMGDHMIEKCAEAFALRRSFPQDLGGMYVEEELQNDPQPDDYRTPKMQAMHRGPASDDDWVVPGTVDGETGEVKTETPADPPKTDKPPKSPENPKPPAATAAQAQMMAIFREYGFAGRPKEHERRNIITYMASGDSPVDRLLNPAELTPAVIEVVARALDSFTKEVESEGGKPAEALTAISKAVDEALSRKAEPKA
jgi:phage recombination protein Bet